MHVFDSDIPKYELNWWMDECLLTHPPWTKWLPFWQTTFSNEFCWKQMVECLFKFHWNLFPRVQLTISQHRFRQWLGAEQATSHYLSQWWHSSPTHVCGARGRWVLNDSFVILNVFFKEQCVDNFVKLIKCSTKGVDKCIGLAYV